MDKELRFCFHLTVSKTSSYPCRPHRCVSTGRICGGFCTELMWQPQKQEHNQRQSWAMSTRQESTMNREISIRGSTHPAERWTFYAHDAKTSECHFTERCEGMASDTPASKNDPKYWKSGLGCRSHAFSPLWGWAYSSRHNPRVPGPCQRHKRQLSNVCLRMSSPPS